MCSRQDGQDVKEGGGRISGARILCFAQPTMHSLPRRFSS